MTHQATAFTPPHRTKLSAARLSARHVLAAVAIATLGACASAPMRNAALEDARANYDRIAADPQVVRSAPLELRKAQQALMAAEATLKAGGQTSAVEHQAYLAKQRTLVAMQAGAIASADQAVANASLERDRILIESRGADADQQRALAELARAQAEKARADAEAARKVAEERLAAAQASQARATAAQAQAQTAQAQAQTAQAQAKSLQDQLAELKAKKTDRGMVLTLGDVLFDTGLAQLNSGASRTLDQLATFMKDNPERNISIEGYTDSVGSDAFNQVLSERRANAVKNALAERGVMSNRVSARGFGEASPVASNGHASGRQQNRRVEIVFIGTT